MSNTEVTPSDFGVTRQSQSGSDLPPLRKVPMGGAESPLAQRFCPSAGVHVLIRPGAVNLMTSGVGTCRSEVSVGSERLNGVPLWVALSGAARDGGRDFGQSAPETVELPRSRGIAAPGKQPRRSTRLGAAVPRRAVSQRTW